MASTALPGAIKRTQRGALVAQIEWHRLQDLATGKFAVAKGDSLTVGDTTATVTSIGGSFKSAGYRYAYVYLEEPQTEPVATPGTQLHRLSNEDVEDAFGSDVAFAMNPGMPSTEDQP